MIVHLFPQEKFTAPYIKFINRNFNTNKHVFLIYGESEAYRKSDLRKFNNIIYVNKKNKKNLIYLIKYTHIADKIILHSLFMPIWIMCYFFIYRILLTKSNWIIWGGDLYSFRDPKTNCKSKVKETLKKQIIKNVECISTLVKNDYELAKEWYDVKCKHKEAMYINPISLQYLNSIEKNPNEKSAINIQIGNSADPSNEHIKCIDLIAKYKCNNIKVYVPLSYGDRIYALRVDEYGKKMLGEKFIAILDFMKPDEYSKFLGSIDIAIFNNNRQQALGNIFALSYLGTKIYMRDDTTMWKQLVVDEGYSFNLIKSIEKVSFNEFTCKNIEQINLNKKKSKERFDENHIASVWRNIFNH